MRRSITTLLSILVAVCGSASVTSANTYEPPDATTLSHRVRGPLTEAASYWTPERMARARPIAELDGRKVLTRSSGAGSGGYEHGEVADPAIYPNSAHGKIFTEYEGSDYKCSATAVFSPQASLVWTAGHCVYSHRREVWASNWVFVPAYREGSTPFGVWPARELFTTDDWIKFGNTEYDVAGALVEPVEERTIQETVGARGIAFNTERDLSVVTLGYPVNDPFDGEHEYWCSSAMGDGYDLGPGPDMVSIGCNMEHGSSGGGWVTEDGSVVSVSSRIRHDFPETLYGPYQGSEAQDLYRSITGIDEHRGSSPPAPATHEVSLTLKLSRSLVASGRMRPTDTYDPCTANVAVVLLRRKEGERFKVVERTTTSDDGSFRFRTRDVRARYVVASRGTTIDPYNDCSPARSPVRRNR